MNDENKNSNNYVAPKSVDLNNADLSEASDILNRERTNIVSATLQANSAINAEDAKVVNNAIKVKKKNPLINALIVIISLIVGGALIFFVLKYSKEFIDKGEEPTTTTTTTRLNMHTKVLNYLTDLSKVRKFETSSRILFLLPGNFDLVNNSLYYFSIDKNEASVINQTYGTYTIVDEALVLDNNERFEITEGGISQNDIILNIYDDEYKYYYSKNEGYNSLLLINGTLKCETSLYLTSDTISTNIIMSGFQENQDSIILSNGTVFSKQDKVIVDNINNKYLTLAG